MKTVTALLRALPARLAPLAGPLAGLALILVLFGILEQISTPADSRMFFSWYNVKLVATQSVIVALCALGMTMVIISGGIDLSVGSVVSFSCVITALALSKGAPGSLALCAGIMAGAACGLLNGVLIAGLRLMPFIATLGTLGAVRGLAKWLAHDQKIDAAVPAWLLNLMARNPPQRWMLFAPGIWLLILGTLVVVILLYQTRLGRHIFAIGGNEKAAILSGVRAGRVKVLLYTFSGLLVGVAGVLQFARLSVGDPTVAIGLELDVIAAVVIGGASLSGGCGSIGGAIIGALIMQFLRNGCVLLGVSNSIQEIMIGAIIVAAVALDQTGLRARLVRLLRRPRGQ